MIHFWIQDTYSQQLDAILRQNLTSWKNSVIAMKSIDAVHADVLIATPPTGRIFSKDRYMAALKPFPRKILWVDWNHLQYSQDLTTALEEKWDLILSCVPSEVLLAGLHSTLSTPIFLLRKSPVLEELCTALKALNRDPTSSPRPIFISQPLRQDRGGFYDQVILFSNLRKTAKFEHPWIVVLHPREVQEDWKDVADTVFLSLAELRNACGGNKPVFWGYNSLLLLAAKEAGHEAHSARMPDWAPNRFTIEETVL